MFRLNTLRLNERIFELVRYLKIFECHEYSTRCHVVAKDCRGANPCGVIGCYAWVWQLRNSSQVDTIPQVNEIRHANESPHFAPCSQVGSPDPSFGDAIPSCASLIPSGRWSVVRYYPRTISSSRRIKYDQLHLVLVGEATPWCNTEV